MSRVEELEGRIKELSSNEFQQLRAWLAEYEAEVWDRQFRVRDDEVRYEPTRSGPSS